MSLFLEHLAQFIPVCGDELLLQLGGFELNGYVIAVGGNESVAALEACDVGNFCICELQGVLNANGLIILKVQDDFCFGIIDDALTILTAFKGKEVIQVLGSCNGSTTIATDNFENLQAELSSKGVTAGTYELLDFVNEDGLLLCSVFLRFIPDIVQSNEHAHGQQVASKLGDIQNGIWAVQVDIGMLIECLCRAMNQSVQDVAKTSGLIRLHQQVIDIA